MTEKKSSEQSAGAVKKSAAVKNKSGSSRPSADTPDSTAGRMSVVAIGASAGGLEALEELFKNMPEDTGLAFVVVTHQHPGHTSMLPDLLGRYTRMEVMEAADGMRLEPNRVHVTPPGEQVGFMDGTLNVTGPPEHDGVPVLIDTCFRALAEAFGECMVCIILSGTGSDGTMGVKAVKAAGGLVLVQETGSARYSGMPASAIATELADVVLPPDEMPEQLIAFARNAMHRAAPDAGQEQKEPELKRPMQEFFALLRSRTGHDFSSYKPSTMRRRIERRMAVHQLRDPADYVRLLRDTPHEIDILFKELLINVTRFFRDADAFQALADAGLPALLDSRPEHYTFRAWIPGCCSGEEAYTLAILLREAVRRSGRAIEFQMFATDLDAEAVEQARAGVYPAGIVADVPAELLKRYFIRRDDTFRVRKEIREMVVFAEQNVIKDPPFTRLDLLSCRNLMIYLNAGLQQRLLPIFHYTLKPGGLMLLGPSESIGAFDKLFEPVDKKWKIFRRRESPSVSLPEMPAQPVVSDDGQEAGCRSGPSRHPGKVSEQIQRMLLDRFAPPSVVVNSRGEIVHIHGRTGMYLEPAAGRPSSNLLDMAREGLQIELAAGLRRALSGDEPVVRPRIRVKTNGDYTLVDLSVEQLEEPDALRGLLLVSFRPSPLALPESGEDGADRAPHDGEGPGRTDDLERELQYTKESLQTTVEELETSNEELKATNEELQSSNEELQSTNEELETSKEEMQSLNEELTTVNTELESKIDELSHANDDMQNLLNSTDIATIFLDSDLNIKRYTEKARKIIRLIPSDVGRPVGDLASTLDYDRLEDDVREVLDTLERRELELKCAEGVSHLVRIMPYRTTDNVIKGVVITFIDISRVKEAEQEAAAERKTQALLQSIFDTFRIPALVLDADLRVFKANVAFCDAFETNLGKTERQLIYDVGGGEWNIPELRKLLEEVIPEQTAITDYGVRADFPKIGERTFRLSARRLERESGLPGMILLTFSGEAAGHER